MSGKHHVSHEATPGSAAPWIARIGRLLPSVSLCVAASLAPFTGALAQAPVAPLAVGQMIPVYPDLLTPRTAVTLAIARHPEISGAEARIARQEAELALAQAGRWPTIQYGIGPGYGGNYGSGGNEAAVRANLAISQPLFDFGATSNRIAAARDQEAAARLTKIDTVEQVAEVTLEAYVNAAIAQESLVASREAIEAMRAVARRIEQREAAGLSDRSDGNAAGIAVIRAELDAENARTAADTALSRLIELIGVSPSRLASLQDTLALVAARDRRPPDFETAPAIAAARSTLDAAQAREQTARAERLPAFSLGASRTYSTGNYSANDATWLGLSVSGNFSLGGAGRQRVAMAEAEAEAARQDLEARRMNTRTGWAVALRQEEGANLRLTNLQSVATLWLATRDLYWEEYVLDKRVLSDVINAEREIYSARAETASVRGAAIAAAVRTLVLEGHLLNLLDSQPAGATGNAGAAP
jgi:adhesin transport system outer membrane protein